MQTAFAAVQAYESTWRRGWLYRLWAALLGRPRDLLDLRAVAAGRATRARHTVGVQTVPIRQIRGSEGRRHDFDSGFHPLQKHTGARWRAIAQAWLDGADMPPIDLIRVGDSYFVRDGHHRVSVARALGQQEIDATVTVWQVDGPPPPARPSIARRLRSGRTAPACEPIGDCAGGA